MKNMFGICTAHLYLFVCLFYDLFNDMSNDSLSKRGVEWGRLKEGFESC